MSNSVEFISTDIGDYPKSWEIKKIKVLGEIITGTTPSTKKQEYYNGNIPFIAPGDMSDIKYIKITQKTLSEKGLSVSRSLPKDSVLVVCIGATIGKTGMTFEEISVTNQQINSIIPNSNIDPHYIYYALSFRSKDLPSLASRAAIPIVNKSNFSEFRIPLPSLEEQKKISLVLSSIQKTIQKVSNVIKSVFELKKSLLHHLFTYGPVPIDQRHAVELQETALGLLPKEWEAKKIGELFDIVQGKSLNKKTKDGPNQLPFLRTSNVFWSKIKLPIIDKMHFSEEQEEKFKLEKDDLLVCEGGAVGRTAIWNNEIELCMCQNHIHRLRTTNPDIIPKFYMYWLEYTISLKNMYISAANWTTIPNLSKSRLNNFIVPVASKDNQIMVCDILTKTDKKIESEVNKKNSLEELFKTLLEKLMTGQIRVNDFNLEEI